MAWTSDDASLLAALWRFLGATLRAYVTSWGPRRIGLSGLQRSQKCANVRARLRGGLIVLRDIDDQFGVSLDACRRRRAQPIRKRLASGWPGTNTLPVSR